VIGAGRLVPDLTSASDAVELRGIGPARSRDLAAAGIRTVADLLLQLPSSYEDRRRLYLLEEIEGPGRYLVRGRIEDLKRVRIRRRNLSLVRGWVADGSQRLPILWFNQPYLMNQIEEGVEYSLYGDFREKGSTWELVNPVCEKVEARQSNRGIVAIYSSVGGVSGPMLRRLMGQIHERFDVQGLPEPLPPHLLDRYSLPAVGQALRSLHQPEPDADVDLLNAGGTAAHARLSYGEFLELQLELSFLRGYETRQIKGHGYQLDGRLRRILLDVLPFRLTGSQRRVLKEISDDLVDPHPMLRLLQGDVGSGKTIVAVLALVMAMENGLQGAFMAPTELLAEQHFRTISELLQNRYRISMLTSSVGDARRIKAQVADGSLQLVIGTHALIQEGLEFRRLGLAVVDEQHRFGVAQRRLLQRKGAQPDLLVMTATPIPRSLALTVYGDLSLSVIDELPPGRRPIETRVAGAADRGELYRWLKEQLTAGLQAYVVFPLIEESDRLSAESIDKLGQRLVDYLGGVESAVLHGRVSAAEREAIMRRFRNGEIRVLIATTVIEVGVDVPNASVMLIESGERFGLSQLHQLRGRVGRGKQQSRCIVIHGSLSEDARRRLEVFAETQDGFRIAEADLEIRGPGDLLGTRQSGAPFFRMADIIRDRDWLERARRDAQELRENLDGRPADEAFLARIRERARSRYDAHGGG
jgi:ATP-dependent DNA helicase RecG